MSAPQQRSTIMNLKNTTVLVTGANRGLGYALSQTLLNAGIGKLYAAVRNPEALDLNDPRVVPVQVDLSDANSIQALASIEELDILINNAGVLRFGDIGALQNSDIDYCMAVNVKAIQLMTQALLPQLSRSKSPRICNILSMLSLASMPGLAAYNLSKAAAWSLTQSMRATLAAQQIGVTAVFPGAIDTDMIAGFDTDKASPNDVAADIVAGLQADAEDVFPTPPVKELYNLWKNDHKSLERQFAAA